MTDILKLFEGLDKSQAKELRKQIVPVLEELRVEILREQETVNMQNIDEKYQQFMTDYMKDRPTGGDKGASIAAIVTAIDIDKTKFYVIQKFKGGGRVYQAGDIFKPQSRMQAVKFAQVGYILPEEEYKAGKRYTANKGKYERVKKLYNDMHNAQAQVIRTAGQVEQTKTALDRAKDEHKQATNQAANIESDLLKELS